MEAMAGRSERDVDSGWLNTPYDTPLQPVKITHRALVHKTTYAPMIYTSLCIMIFDAGILGPTPSHLPT